MPRLSRVKFLVAVFLAFLFVFGGLWPAEAEELEIKGQSYILIEAESGQVVASKEPDKKCYPASITKIMTLVLTLEELAAGNVSLEDKVVTSETAESMGGSQVYLEVGEERTLHEMLIAIAVGSGNDASVAVAEFIAGSETAFVELMNNKAKELGMENTNFVNSHGLHDDNHYTSAADMARIAMYAISVPKFLEYTSIYEYQFRPDPKPLVLWNTNKLLKWYGGTDGMKTGYTAKSHYNLVATAQRENLRFISVVLGVQERNGHYNESIKLLNYGFNNYKYNLIYDEGAKICEVPVAKGKYETVQLVAAKKVGLAQAKKEAGEITTKIEINKNLQAPLAEKTQVGEIVVLSDGVEVKRVGLLAEKEVPRAGLMQFWWSVCQAILSLA